jgi:hypothetical protein
MNNQNTTLVIILFTATILLGFSLKEILRVDELVLSSLAEQFSKEQLEKIIPSQKRLQTISYFFIPLMLILKISIIAAILDVGMFFFDRGIKYKKLFNIVTKAEFIFLLVIIFKIFWFYVFQPNYTLKDIEYFYPFSALNIIGYEGLQTWYIYPFQVLNLFEIAYWFILAYLMGKELKTSTEKGLTIVASSYGVGLLIWVVGVMFFTLNMS